jgi:osmotically-inducible protein OsmY
MTYSNYFRVTGCALLLTGLFSGCAVQSKLEGDSQDAQTTADVETLIEQHPDLDPANTIYVSTRDHVVYLSGLVDSALEITEAKALAAQAPGAAEVVSTIGVAQ